MTYQLTALIGSDPIGGPSSAGVASVLPWVLSLATMMGVIGVLFGGGVVAYGFYLRNMGGLDDGTIGRGTATLLGGVLVTFSAGLVNVVIRPESDVAADRPVDAAPPVTALPVPATTSVPATPSVSTPAPATPVTPMDWTPVIVAGSIVLALAFLAGAVFAIVRTRSHLTDRAAADKARRADFAAATAIYTDVADRYAEYLADPYAIFTRPLLDDTSDHLTARFIDAFVGAGALRPTTCPTDPARIETFRTAAHSALRAWNTADTHARKIGMGPRTDDETRTLRRIRDALALAFDDAATPGERDTALITVHRLAEGLITIPERITDTVQLQLTGTTRTQLTR